MEKQAETLFPSLEKQETLVQQHAADPTVVTNQNIVDFVLKTTSVRGGEEPYKEHHREQYKELKCNQLRDPTQVDDLAEIIDKGQWMKSGRTWGGIFRLLLFVLVQLQSVLLIFPSSRGLVLVYAVSLLCTVLSRV